MRDVQQGLVLKLDGEFAKIRVLDHENCVDCKMCNVAGMELIAYNAAKANPGQTINFKNAQNGGMFKIAFMLFIFPLISIFAGLYAGSVLSNVFLFNKSGAMAIGALLLLALSVYIAVLYDKKYKLNTSNFPQIIEVIIK